MSPTRNTRRPTDGLNPKNETLGKGTLCRERKLQVAKKRVGRYPNEFRRKAVERLKSCENIVALSQELGVHRRLLYKWRDQLDPVEPREESPPQNSRESTLRKEVHQLKRLLADKTLEVDFFKGALQKIEARRQRNGSSGEKASTTKSGT
jgi:transposase